ncbi:hypothetical protein O3Q51_04790 [Cryomorphaceae bacterium 1068]|nr:hypothetical protein [Cryomorphaceae bacterium 1068]
MKKFLIVVLVLIAVGAISFFVADEALPEGNAGPDAEALSEKVLDAVGYEAWEKIPFVAWSFRDAHHYVWDKEKHVARVKWDDYEAAIDLNTISGRASKAGVALEGAELDEAVQTAWAYFCNDSFWLNAPAKIKDSGTTRKIVIVEDGSQQLLVQYESGGVTPGDAYLWKLDENYLPTSYKMWVSIIPVGGVEASWEDWVEKEGAMISTSHKMGPLEIPIGNLKVGRSPEDFDLAKDFFTSTQEK